MPDYAAELEKLKSELQYWEKQYPPAGLRVVEKLRYTIRTKEIQQKLQEIICGEAAE